MLCWISIFGGLRIMMGHHARSEALFYYFRERSSSCFFCCLVAEAVTVETKP